ncbi:uncharacterized protein N7503_001065 [Penicillium pulvis]|uniref:uncharacterized protein n=1 Tax=Penicillium pulvis TaxID=1562058 RepID=UPI002546C274|nr:uncharacterized protein N7503_001065 [Penicillium pulvis]KAJ5814315.1 hypothetical protein N7503_001065 [Penicillium pulvis]
MGFGLERKVARLTGIHLPLGYLIQIWDMVIVTRRVGIGDLTRPGIHVLNLRSHVPLSFSPQSTFGQKLE